MTLSPGFRLRPYEIQAPIGAENLPWSANYDVTPDGQRFLMIQAPDAAAASRINVVLNWFEELKRKVPAKQ